MGNPLDGLFPIRRVLRTVGDVIEAMKYRPNLHIVGATVTDDATYVDEEGNQLGRTVVTFEGGGEGSIADDAVTNAKLADMATQRIKGRTTAGTGDPEDLTPAQVRTMLNVADGATAGAVSSDSATIDFSGAGTAGSPLTGSVKAGSITAAMCAADVATQAELDAEATTRAAADTALDLRLDDIEDNAWVPDHVNGQAIAPAAVSDSATGFVWSPLFRTGSVNFASAQTWADLGATIGQSASTATLHELTIQVDNATMTGAGEAIPGAVNETRVIHLVTWRNGSSVCAFVVASGESEAWGGDAWDVGHVQLRLLDASGAWKLQVQKNTSAAYTGTVQVRVSVRAMSEVPWTADTSPTLVLFGGGGGGGVALSDATPLGPGTAAAGSGADASRDDHVHPLLSESQLRSVATGLTATFAVNGQTVSNCAGMTRASGDIARTATSGNIADTASGTYDLAVGGAANVGTGSTSTTVKSAGKVAIRATADTGDTLAVNVTSSEAVVTSSRAIKVNAGALALTGLTTGAALWKGGTSTGIESTSDLYGYCISGPNRQLGATKCQVCGPGGLEITSDLGGTTVRVHIRIPADVATSSTSRAVLATIPIPTGAMRRIRASVKGWPAGAAGGAWTVDLFAENVGGSVTKYGETITLVPSTQNLGTIDATVSGTDITIGVTPGSSSGRTWHVNDLGDV